MVYLGHLTHFSHANIILYSKRPFTNEGDTYLEEGTGKPRWSSRQIANVRKKEMDEAMILNWNAVVKEDDEVYHLGDVTFGNTADAIQILRRLNGKLKFIWGNHDKAMMDLKSIINFYSDLKDRVEFLGHYEEIYRYGEMFCLFHYPILVWNKMHHGSYALCGHSHGTCVSSNPVTTTTRLLDVGVDSNNFRPWSIEEILEHLKDKKVAAFDHHSG